MVAALHTPTGPPPSDKTPYTLDPRKRETGMSFRGRLRLFFTIIVIVPMIAVAVVLFTLTARSETGKADAGIAAGLRNAFAVYDRDSGRARPALNVVGRDPQLRAAILRKDRLAARRRLRALSRSRPSI